RASFRLKDRDVEVHHSMLNAHAVLLLGEEANLLPAQNMFDLRPRPQKERLGQREMRHLDGGRRESRARKHKANGSPRAAYHLVSQLRDRVNGNRVVFVFALNQPVQTSKPYRPVNLLLGPSAEEIDGIGPCYLRLVQLEHPDDEVLKSLALRPPRIDSSGCDSRPEPFQVRPF